MRAPERHRFASSPFCCADCNSSCLQGRRCLHPRPAGSCFVRPVTAATPLPNGIELRDGVHVMQHYSAARRCSADSRIGHAALPEDASWAVLPEARTASVSRHTG